jgi:hypothetical protein
MRERRPTMRSSRRLDGRRRPSYVVPMGVGPPRGLSGEAHQLRAFNTTPMSVRRAQSGSLPLRKLRDARAGKRAANDAG